MYHESIHLISSLLVGLAFYAKYKKLSSFVIALIFGFFIDVDHLFDYFFQNGFVLSPAKFFAGEYFAQSQRVFVLLHGWEILGVLGLLGVFAKKRRGIFLPAFFSMLLHVLLDQFSYITTPYSYFLIYRALKGFSLSAYLGVMP